MRGTLKIISLITGAIAMFSFCGCFGGVKYGKYSSKDPELNISMDYILGWSHAEQRGSYGSFAQVVFYKPKVENKTYSALIVVTIEPAAKVKFTPVNIQGMEEDLLKKRSKFEDSKLVSKSKIKLLGMEATNVELAYRAIDKIYALDAKIIPIRERIVILQITDKFYTLRYENTAEDFAKFEKAFYRCIKTIRFKDNS